jgi:CheY-like chemotaxis protein
MKNEPVKKRKVCVVDDEETIREIYSTALEASGYEVFTAVDGQEGFSVIKKNKPDIILTDIMMPEIDGLTMMRKLKKDPELSNIPVVVMTNVDNTETSLAAGRLNPYFYLVKSLFDPQKVVSIVAEILQNK